MNKLGNTISEQKCEFFLIGFVFLITIQIINK